MAIDPYGGGYGGGGFLFGGNTGQTLEGLAGARQRMAMAMLQQGMNADPIRSPWQGAARMAQALIGGMQMHEMMGQEQGFHQELMNALSGMGMGGQGGGNAFPPAPAPPAQQGDSSAPTPNPDVADGPKGQESYPVQTPSAMTAYADPQAQDNAAQANGDMSHYQNAIAGIESGGRYNLVGPTSPKMGRALGKYQIMEANLPQWSQEALGRTVSPQEFLQNPQIQDAIFNHKFGQYVSQFGPQGAAQAWFAGPGGVGKMNRHDSLGTTVAAYTSKFNRGMGQQGTQVASLDPSIGMPVPPNGGDSSIQPPQAPGPAAPTPGYRDPTVSAPNYQPQGGQPQPQPQAPGPMSSHVGPEPVPESAYAATGGGSPAADAINTQAPIDPSQSIPMSGTTTPYQEPHIPAGAYSGAPIQGPSLPQADPTFDPGFKDQGQQTAQAAPQQMSAQFQAGAPWDQSPGKQNLAQAAQSLQGGVPQLNSPQFKALMEVMTSPYASPGDRQLAGQMLQMQFMRTPSFHDVQDQDGITHVMETDYMGRPMGELTVNGLVPPGSQQGQGQQMAQGGQQQGQPTPLPPRGTYNVPQYRKANADALAKNANPSPSDKLEYGTKLLDRHKDYTEALQTWNALPEIAKENDPPGDTALIDGVAKVINPGLAVRQGTYAVYTDEQSGLNKLWGTIQKETSNGGVMSTDTKAQLLRVAYEKIKSYKNSYDIDLTQAKKLITNRPGWDPDNDLPTLPDVATVDTSTINTRHTEADGKKTPPPPAQAQPQISMPTEADPGGGQVLGDGKGNYIQWNKDHTAWKYIKRANDGQVPTGG